MTLIADDIEDIIPCAHASSEVTSCKTNKNELVKLKKASVEESEPWIKVKFKANFQAGTSKAGKFFNKPGLHK